MGDVITAEDATQQLHEAETELRQLHRVSTRQINTEMGVVGEIYCENFMCHRKLRVTLSPHINFITGENGSGKSAIVAAIQICLGASARSTHRGKNIKNLIRHGHEGNALVRITLRNDAVDSDAFRLEQFGHKIQVERLIRRDGSAEYRLKDERGIVVSKLKTDLDAMLDHLNIQTDNPCGILDQDNAKLFLKGTPEDKYKFFLQATDLEKMSWTYAKIDEVTRNIADSTLINERAKISTLKTAVDQAKKQWTKAKNVQHLEEEVEMLQKELTWSVVEKKEAETAKMEKKIEQKKRDAEHVTGKYDETKEAVDNLEKKQKEKNDKLEEIHVRMNENSQRKSEVKNRIREARRPLHNCKAELKQLTQAKQRSHQRLSRLQHDLQKKRENHETMLRNRMQRNHEMRESIEMKRQEVHDAENEVIEAKYKIQARPQEMDEVENRHDNCVRQLREADSEADKTQHRMNQLKSQKRDSLAVFGNRIPQLQQLIQQNRHRFSAPPIGPLGLHVKLPERFKHFAVAIEVALKGTLASYLVVDGRDKALLDDLKRQVHCPQNQANIIISQRNGYRYGNLRLAEGNLAAHAICNILEVDNDEVFNALLDVCEMENKLLFDDRESAEVAVLSGSGGSFRMARFVSEVYLPNGDKFVVRNGNLAYIANKKKRRSSIICHDVEGEIKELRKKLDYLQENVEVLRHEESQLRRERDGFRHQMRQQNDTIDYLSRQINKKRAELRNLEEELSDDMQSNTLDTSVLEDEIRAVHDELKAFHRHEQELKDLIAKANPDLDGHLHELEDLNAMEKKITTEINNYQKDADTFYKHLSEMKIQEMTYQNEVVVLREMVMQCENNLTVLQEERDELDRKAQEHCDRVAVRYSHDYYEKRLAKLQCQIDKVRNQFQGMDLAQLKNDFDTKQLKYKDKKANFDKFQGNLYRIRFMLEERQRVWQLLRKHIADQTSKEFNRYMALNNFVGKLRFRHGLQRLEIAVLHNEVGVSRASQVTDMRELSGGERSYTQISLLLALGKKIECPFRVMDEFDVFMDSANRDMTIELLVTAAKEDCKKQFIFVTPNDLSLLSPDPMVIIQKMDPPRDRVAMPDK